MAINEWLPSNTWRLQFYSDDVKDPFYRQFFFHHVRTTDYKVALADHSIGGHKNETTIIEPYQSSLIVGLEPGCFKLITITSNYVDRRVRLSVKDYEIYLKLGQAKFWYFPFGLMFEGPYEVFNGPNPIAFNRQVI